MVGMRELEDRDRIERCPSCSQYMPEGDESCAECGWKAGRKGSWLLTIVLGLGVALLISGIGGFPDG